MTEIHVNIVGANTYGRYSTISDAQTYNMFISDNWLVPFAGYKIVLRIANNGEGRGIFNSARSNTLIIVVNNGVYVIDESLYYFRVGSIDTYSGDVFIAENDAYQIAICDKKNIYIYDYRDGTFGKASLEEGFLPAYIAFQDGYFIAPMEGEPTWRLSDLNNGFSWPSDAYHVGRLQGKPDDAVACIPIPSRTNAIFVMGKSIAEHWVDQGINGSKLFPYQRSSGFNIDYGCVNQATIAAQDNFVIWLAASENSKPVIMYSNGGNAIQISNDGINFKLSQLKHPEKSYAFIFKQDGKLFYIITFTDLEDNFTLLCDLDNKIFYSLCLNDMSAFKAKKATAFNNSYYFVSFDDGNLYELSSKYNFYGNTEIPRIRICDTIRKPTGEFFISKKLSIILEQGFSETKQYIDMSVSRDGAATFGNFHRYQLNNLGNRINNVVFWNLGRANALTFQFRFHGFNRFLVTNGIMEII